MRCINLERMRQFADLYPAEEFPAQLVPQLPWGHIVVLMQKLAKSEVRAWYAQKAVEHGWSRSILTMQMETQLYERQALNDKKVSNYHNHLPKPQSDLARDILKDPYNFDFLTIQENAHEREIERALTTHIRDFLLELGEGFAFVGSQVPITIDDQEFFIDILFYHLKLRAYIVAEIKAVPFKPEHAGQIGFYLAAVDDLLRHENDNRTIGILLCKKRNKIVAEYALQNINAPIGVSEYTLSKALPKELKTSLPTIEEIEAELNPINKPSKD